MLRLFLYLYTLISRYSMRSQQNNPRAIAEQFILIGTVNMFLDAPLGLCIGMEYSMNWNNKMNEQMVYAGLTDLQPRQVPQWAQAENLERIRPLRELWKLSGKDNDGIK